jgi:hypothetical protein
MSLLFFALMLSADAITATSSTTAATTSQDASATADAPKDEKKICKREQDSTSRMGSKRVCMTAEQWKKRDTAL